MIIKLSKGDKPVLLKEENGIRVFVENAETGTVFLEVQTMLDGLYLRRVKDERSL